MNTITRRTALAVPVTLPLLPVSAYAGANATDAAWAAYEAAWANYDANEQAQDAFEAAIPIGPRPAFDEFGDRDEWERQYDAWGRERAKHTANPFALDDDQLDAMCDPINAAEDAIFAARATTLTDIEHKLAVLSKLAKEHDIQPSRLEGILADVRRMAGVTS